MSVSSLAPEPDDELPTSSVRGRRASSFSSTAPPSSPASSSPPSSSDGLPLPAVLRGDVFSDPGARTVAAAFDVLDAGLQQALLAELQGRLAKATDGNKSNYDVKLARAVSALREAAELLAAEENHTDLGAVQVSKNEYMRLRGLHPERTRRWPVESTIRSWMATRTWNEALRIARLSAVPDGDLVVRRFGAHFSDDECLAALRAAVEDLGWSDVTPHEYIHWARRADVRGRPGRRPQSISPFKLRFGSFGNALSAALSDEAAAGLQCKPRRASYALPSIKGQPCTSAIVVSAIRIVAAHIDDAPRPCDYTAARDDLLDEAVRLGRPAPVLPHRDTIRTLYPRWDEALEAAGLTPYTRPEQRKISEGYRRLTGHESYTEERIEQCLRRAFDEIDKRFTVQRYADWRRDRLAADARERRRGIPTYACLLTRGFRSWREMCDRYLPEGWDEQ